MGSVGNPVGRRNLVHEYELMLILNPELDEEGQQAATGRVQSFVTDRNGEFMALEPIGRRRLAYQINRQRDGYYTIARFKMDPAGADELDRSLKLAEPVIRHLIIRKD
jgi:small subunit ribosomal protein S6